MSDKTPVERAGEQLDRSHWDGQGCGTHGTNACTYCFGPSPMTTAEVVEQVLTAAAEDREGLAEAMQQADWRAALHGVAFADLPERDRAWWLDLADAVARWLTGDS